MSSRFVLPFVLCAAFISLASTARSQSPTFAPAEKKDSPSSCTGGAFLDARLDDWSAGPQCWSCPSGFTRTLDPVTSATACFKDGATDHRKAAFKHKWLCDGEKREFLDPRKGGECWRCPADKPRRTLYSVAGSKACATPEIIGEKLGAARFVRKVKTCTDGAFWDPRRGGECWKCPSGYARTDKPVNENKACAKMTSSTHASAKLENQLGCPKGQVLDPRNGGECWKCPTGHQHRTVFPVTEAKACTDNLLGIFPIEASSVCKELIRSLDRALDEGAKGAKALEDLTRPIIEPVASILQQELARMNDLVGDVEALEKLIAKAQGTALQMLEPFSKVFGDRSDNLRRLLLRDDLCTMTPRELEKRIKGVLAPPDADTFLAVSFGVTFTHSIYRATAQFGITVITDLGGKGGIFLTGKVGATSSEDPFSVGVSAMLFPKANLDDFGLSPVPGITVTLAKGNNFNEIFKGYPKLLTATKVIDGIDISWSPATPAKVPTFGAAKSLFTKEGNIASLVDFSAVAGWDFPLVTWANYTKR